MIGSMPTSPIHTYDVSVLRSLMRRDSLAIGDDIREMSPHLRAIGRAVLRTELELRAATLQGSLGEMYGREPGNEILEEVLEGLGVLP